ncbi:AraC family transcriptional regulator [Frigoribacterium faeni]|uniref:AraC family transcriptional regulator n=1 Tax=Frigoribacterium faeni TaxID=145483 RepID=UPI00141BB4E1|nr:helix-turn-helix domain-containing protein [Frigoribacterium faeni]NIJ04504.1 AraC-like DNA-binding protein [Frigoribacterium faeni]
MTNTDIRTDAHAAAVEAAVAVETPDAEAATGAAVEVDGAAEADSAPALDAFSRDAWSGNDMEEARAQLEAALDGRHFRARRGADEFSFRFATAGDRRLSLQTGTFLGHLQGVIPWSRDYSVSWFPMGSCTIEYPHGQLRSVAGRPFLTPTETSYSFSMTPHRHSIVQIDAEFLEGVAARRHGAGPQRIVFDYAAVPGDDALAAWRTTLDAVTPRIVSPTTPAAERLEAQTELVEALLDLFPWRAVDVPPELRTERTRRLRLAAEYVHAYVDQAITSRDIAAAADMHPRTLQLQMSEHLGSSPTNYVRTVRLDRARLDLLAGEPGTTLVSEVARRWGFGNLGRFSAAYAARFGEYPRDTLAR